MPLKTLIISWGVVFTCATRCVAADPEPPALAMPSLQTVVEEPFGTDAYARFERFGNGTFTSSRNSLELAARPGQQITFVRPAAAGSVSEMTLDVGFPALTEESPSAETRIGYLTEGREILSVGFERELKPEGLVSRVQLLHTRKGPDGQDQEHRLRSFPLQHDLSPGPWQLVLHHGYLRVTHDKMLIAAGDFDLQPISSRVVGILLNQRAGSVVFRDLRLAAPEEPSPLTTDQQEELNQAVDANRRAGQLYQTGKLDEALPAYMEAFVNFQQARGETDPETGNALTHLARVFRAQGDLESARKTYLQSLAIQEKSLGAAHPQTARVHFELGALLASLGEQEAARRQLTPAQPVFDAVFGPEHPDTRKLHQLLSPAQRTPGERVP